MKFTPNSLWARAYAIEGLSTGKVRWVAFNGATALDWSLWFHSQELAKHFPPKSDNKKPHVSDLPQKPGRKGKAEHIARTMLHLWPNEIPEGQTFDQTHNLVVREVNKPGFSFKRDTYSKARRIAYPDE